MVFRFLKWKCSKLNLGNANMLGEYVQKEHLTRISNI